MSAEENKALVRRWVELWNEKNIPAVNDFVAQDYVRHDPNAPAVYGPEAEKELIATYLDAFPDLHFTIEDLVTEDDKVAARLTARGTHQGELLGIPATQRQITVPMIETYRLADGKIAEQWVVMDVLGMLQQLGAIPSPGQANT